MSARTVKAQTGRPRVIRSSRARILFEAAPALACLQLPLVNLYMAGPPGAEDRRWALVDAGLRFFDGRIVRAAAARFGPHSRPAAIILTHGHFDHVGALPQLARLWDVPVYAHELELPYLTGRSSYPPPDPTVGGGAMSLLSSFYPRGPIDLGERVRPLPTDGTVPGMPDWRWVYTPGHSPGHVSLFREADRTLVAGDAFVTVKQESMSDVLFRQERKVRRPPAYYTTDWRAARRSVEALARLQPQIAATGHGLPMRGDALRQQLEDLVRRWDKLARPPRGRYVRQPAVADATGVVSVPPPAYRRTWRMVAGAGLAALAIAAVAAALSSRNGWRENGRR